VLKVRGMTKVIFEAFGHHHPGKLLKLFLAKVGKPG